MEPPADAETHAHAAQLLRKLSRLASAQAADQANAFVTTANVAQAATALERRWKNPNHAAQRALLASAAPTADVETTAHAER